MENINPLTYRIVRWEAMGADSVAAECDSLWQLEISSASVSQTWGESRCQSITDECSKFSFRSSDKSLACVLAWVSARLSPHKWIFCLFRFWTLLPSWTPSTRAGHGDSPPAAEGRKRVTEKQQVWIKIVIYDKTAMVKFVSWFYFLFQFATIFFKIMTTSGKWSPRK